MTTDRYQWHFTFLLEPLDFLTIEEGHPDIKFVSSYQGSQLVAATLVDTSRYSVFKDTLDETEYAVHHTPLQPSRLDRVFRRCEIGISSGTERKLPAFEFTDIGTGLKQYCFAYPDRLIITANSRFFRGDNDDEYIS